MAAYAWPPVPSGEATAWTGDHFEVGGRPVPFVPYSENLAGWDDGLTSLHQRESAGTHPIDITSRFNAINGLKRVLARKPDRILEIGSSEGIFLAELKQAFPDTLVVGSEVAPGALAQIARDMPGTPLLQLDILNCPLPPASFDAIVALNVLEHIEDDQGALVEIARLLSPGGVALLEVPAGPGLYDAYDKQLHHFRRYRMRDLLRKVRAAGLSVDTRTHVGFLVYPGFAAVKLRNRAQGAALEGKDVVGTSLRQSRHNPIVSALFAAERGLFGRVSWPVGIRCLVVATKGR